MKIFKYTYKDSILVILTIICIVIPILFSFYLDHLNIYEILLLGLFCSILLAVYLNTALHHCVHVHFFNNKKLNKLFEYIMSIPAGMGFEEYRYIHIEHHKYSNDRYINGKIKDPISTYRFGKNGEHENFWSYVFKSVLGRDYFYAPELTDRFIKINWKEIKIQNYIKLGFLLILGLINYKFIFIYLLIVYLGLLINSANNYCEHYMATDWQDRKKDSVSCYNKWYNLLLFNSGYHQEHHTAPGVHWADLPKLTEYLPPDRNIVKYTTFHNNPYYRKK